MSFGWTNLISSIISNSFSNTAQTNPSKSLRVTNRNFLSAIGFPRYSNTLSIDHYEQ